MKKINTFYSLALGLLVVVGSIQPVLAQQTTQAASTQNYLSRGEIVSRTVQAFDLRNKQKSFIQSCLTHLDQCFFAFTGMSRFSIKLEPDLVLYPDVSVAYSYYDDVNLATMLGIVHGYIDEKESPFYPRSFMTRMEALKVILGASKLLDWKERFELVASLGGEENLEQQMTSFADVKGTGDHWWYPRYVNLALEKGIIDQDKSFRPNEYITEGEFQNMLDKAQKAATLENGISSSGNGIQADSK
ncbi:MAG: S-layer homology domain-containing protein [Candidatus Gracilibacteria bacterium]|jgi:hypothetical protein